MNQNMDEDNPIFSFTLIDKKRENDVEKQRQILEDLVGRGLASGSLYVIGTQVSMRATYPNSIRIGSFISDTDVSGYARVEIS